MSAHQGRIRNRRHHRFNRCNANERDGKGILVNLDGQLGVLGPLVGKVCRIWHSDAKISGDRFMTLQMTATPSVSSRSSLSPPFRPMSLKIYISGKYYDKENAKISVYDHGLLYGDGVFEGMRSYGGKVFRLKQHLDRLWASAKAIWLKMPINQEEMAKAVNETLATNGIKDGYIRLVVTRGAGALGLDPNKCSDPQVIIIADHIQLYPKEMYEKGLEIVTASTIRNHSAALSPRIKSLNYLNNIMAKIEGLQAGCV